MVRFAAGESAGRFAGLDHRENRRSQPRNRGPQATGRCRACACSILSRVIAGPVAGRTLAAHGADALLISGPDLPAIPWLTIDTGRGKLSTFLDLKSEEGRKALRELLAEADIFSQGYRPRSLARSRLLAGGGSTGSIPASFTCRCRLTAMWDHGRSAAASTRWCRRRPASTMRREQAAGVDGPKELPAQILDHATGYLMAFGAMMAKARQSREGGSWHVRVSLAQTGRWIWNFGRVADGLKTEDLEGEAIKPFVEQMPSGFGSLQAIRHAAQLSRTPAFWSRPAMPLGSNPPQWPARIEAPAVRCMQVCEAVEPGRVVDQDLLARGGIRRPDRELVEHATVVDLKQRRQVGRLLARRRRRNPDAANPSPRRGGPGWRRSALSRTAPHRDSPGPLFDRR